MSRAELISEADIAAAERRPKKRVSHTARTVEWAEGYFLGVFYKVDSNASSESRGAKRHVTRDLFGIADVAGVEAPNGRLILINITTEKQFGAHIRKWASPATMSGGVGTRKRLLKLLAAGARVFLVAWEQSGGCGRYCVKHREVTVRAIERVMDGEDDDE